MFGKIPKIVPSDNKLAMYGKITTVVLGVTAMLVALTDSRAIFWFVLFAWSGLGAAFGPVILCSLYWRRMTKSGAIAGMLSGFLVTVFWVLFAKENAYDLYEMVPAFITGIVSIIVVSMITSRKDELPE